MATKSDEKDMKHRITDAVRRGITWVVRSKTVLFVTAMVLLLIIVVRLLKYYFLNI
jgi:hypothetical protein